MYRIDTSIGYSLAVHRQIGDVWIRDKPSFIRNLPIFRRNLKPDGSSDSNKPIAIRLSGE